MKKLASFILFIVFSMISSHVFAQENVISSQSADRVLKQMVIDAIIDEDSGIYARFLKGKGTISESSKKLIQQAIKDDQAFKNASNIKISFNGNVVANLDTIFKTYNFDDQWIIYSEAVGDAYARFNLDDLYDNPKLIKLNLYSASDDQKQFFDLVDQNKLTEKYKKRVNPNYDLLVVEITLK